MEILRTPDEQFADLEGNALLQGHIPGTAGQPYRLILNASHFIQEDAPEILIDSILEFTAAART
jgi:hypothetical protein